MLLEHRGAVHSKGGLVFGGLTHLKLYNFYPCLSLHMLSPATHVGIFLQECRYNPTKKREFVLQIFTALTINLY